LIRPALRATRVFSTYSRIEQNNEYITEIDDLLFVDVVDLWQCSGFLGAERNV
jgi:hypothetical protein